MVVRFASTIRGGRSSAPPPVPKFFRDTEVSLAHVGTWNRWSISATLTLDECSSWSADKSFHYIDRFFDAPKVRRQQERHGRKRKIRQRFWLPGLDKASAKEVRDWARADFERYRHEKDIVSNWHSFWNSNSLIYNFCFHRKRFDHCYHQANNKCIPFRHP